MNRKYKEIIAKLLVTASDKFGYHGCNDIPGHFFEDWTAEDRRKLVKDMHTVNGDPEEYRDDELDVPDWWLMEYMAHLLLKECEDAKTKME